MPEIVYYVRCMGFPIGVGTWFDSTTEGPNYGTVAQLAIDALTNPDVFVTHINIGYFSRDEGEHPTK